MIDFLNRNSVRFKQADIRQSVQNIYNPGRGWYQVFTFRICDETDWYPYLGCVQNDDTIALIILDIGAYRNRQLGETELKRVKDILEFFVQLGIGLIVRTVYDCEGKGMEKEPDSIFMVQEHMRQLGPVFKLYSEKIYCLQGLFVGSWGEMHTSKFVSEMFLVRLADTLWESTQGSCFMAVRTPVQHRMLAKSSKVDISRIGIFDDGMFGSTTHLGTFMDSDYDCVDNGTDSSDNSNVYNMGWSICQELEYMSKLKAPVGGEAISGCEYDLTEIIGQMKKMQVCYLNRVYDEKILNNWKNIFWNGKDIFNGMNLYEYIGAHLGYRLYLLNISAKINRNTLYMDIDLENDGFCEDVYTAGLSNELSAEIYISDTESRTSKLSKNVIKGRIVYSVHFEVDKVDAWRGGNVIFRVYAADGRQIRLANEYENGYLVLGSIN